MKINSYDKLKEYVKAMNTREITLLIIKSRGGLGKTYTTESQIPERDRLTFKGHATPLSVYLDVYENPTKIILFDDVDSLLDNKSMVAIMKQLCEVKQDKDVFYNTSASRRGKPVPPSFKSNNQVILLCNDIKDWGEDMKAVLTRGFFIDFEPSNIEIFEQLKKFAKDKVILNFLENRLKFIHNFNFRIYSKAEQLKNAGLDWKNWIDKEHKVNSEEAIMYEVMKLPLVERNEDWKRRTGKSVRSLQRMIRNKKDVEVEE